MNLPQFISLLIAVGLLIWFVYKYIPMNREVRRVLTIVLTVAIAYGIAVFFDVLDFLN